MLLPALVDRYMRLNGLKVRVSGTDSTWFGVTYADDRPKVVAKLQALHDSGEYPTPLFGE